MCQYAVLRTFSLQVAEVSHSFCLIRIQILQKTLAIYTVVSFLHENPNIHGVKMQFQSQIIIAKVLPTEECSKLLYVPAHLWYAEYSTGCGGAHACTIRELATQRKNSAGWFTQNFTPECTSAGSKLWSCLHLLCCSAHIYTATTNYVRTLTAVWGYPGGRHKKERLGVDC